MNFSIRRTTQMAVAVLAAFAAFGMNTAFAQSNAAIQMLLGNPSNATTSTSNSSNYLIQRPQYALAYSSSAGVPNWVSWHLNYQDLGSASRTSTFSADTSLPSGWYRVTSSDYTNSGYDRGHNCPSADRTATAADNKALFLMTNIMPQAPDNNQGPWEALESYCRSLVSAGNELYIISTYDSSNGTIAGGKVNIPGYTDKIIVVLPENNNTNDIPRITTSTRVIAVSMPNTNGIRNVDWKTYRVSVSALETWTGYHFLTNVPSSIANVLKAKIDNQ